MVMMEMKLELEKVYKKYCLGELKELKGEEFIDSLEGFVKFRLSVSGGSVSQMGEGLGCQNVKGFLNELFLFQDMMDDWSGQYRGDFCYECLETLEEILEGSDLEESVKNEIVESWKKKYEMDEE